jgi:hypothetical protein
MLRVSLCALFAEERGIWAEAWVRQVYRRSMAIGLDQSRRLMCWIESHREI